MSVKYFIIGFFVKLITGLDDTITHIPVLASVTKTRAGRIAFSIGTLLAIIFAIVLAQTFAVFIKNFAYARFVSAGLVFALAIIIYFDLFFHEPLEKKEEKFLKAEEKILKLKRISPVRFVQLLSIGFIASVATVLDDIVAYSSLFVLPGRAAFAIAGILIATITEILVVVYFSKQISHIKYKNEIASGGLVLLGILILAGIV